MALLYLIFILLTVLILSTWLLLKIRHADIWFISYIKGLVYIKPNSDKVKHIYICLADHYEPYFGQATQDHARGLVDDWVKQYREISSKHSDSFGNPPQHSYFYPIEEYDAYVMDELSSICKEKLGDVDIHLHHDDDNEKNLTKTLNNFKKLLFDRHQLLRKDNNGNIVYGFIHGNWALDNSRPDGKWCGVNNEIDVLVNTGCVFDMTMPSAPSDTQTGKINSVYFTSDDGKPKSHDKGWDAAVGKWGNNRELLMIQGPLAFNWGKRNVGLIPKIETGELSFDAPPNLSRVKLWEKFGVSIKSAEEHIFIKLYTHGLQKKNMKMFFDNGGFEKLWTSLESEYKDKPGYKLHYVNAWEMYLKIKDISSDEY